ncbi:type II secretion system major pseudopilin GspG [Labrys wisconsinensis]|nr:type II secretion system major pseudopilin GspG [Labrys wisconsinensis]
MPMSRGTSAGRGLAPDAGLTLIELLVVLVILGLIATIGGIQVVNYLGRARADTARLQIEDLSSAIDLFRIDIGRPPTPEEGLAALVDQPAQLTTWRGPYLRKRASLADPWARPWIYRSPAGDAPFEIVSLGADGKPGGDGDDRDISSNDRR